MIDLGLKRIAQLVPNSSSLPWKSIHVAGTNGKGSICAYLTAVLTASSIPNGRFTSPHLLHRSDCITINNAPISPVTFSLAEETILARNAALSLNATEFELLTATAFECFTRENVEIGVIEVGLGGRLDATNILENKIACVLAKVDLDHMGFLGNTLGEIAREKAGIAREGVVMVVDGTNEEEVMSTVQKVAEEAKARVMVARGEEQGVGKRERECVIETERWRKMKFGKYLPGGFQKGNLACAVKVLEEIAGRWPWEGKITRETVEKGVGETKWPGRLETVEVEGLGEVLLDGAHNPAAAKELRKYLGEEQSVVWVLAFSKGKDVKEMLDILLRKRDKVIATKFGDVDGMPWVAPVEGQEITTSVGEGVEVSVKEEVIDAVHYAFGLAESNHRVVIAGSLYLVGEFLRKLKESKTT